MNPPRQRRLRTSGGLELALLEWNADSRSDRTLLLIHGFLDLAWGFQALVDAGLGDRHIIAPDMRGHGDSDHIGGGGYYYFVDYIGDIADIVKQCARRDLAVLGHSMGGTIAAYYAGTFPDRVSHLALLEGIGPLESVDAFGPERVRMWLAGVERLRARAQGSYASIADAAARLRDNDTLCSEPVSLFLAEKGTRRGEDGRYRFKHDPLHVTHGPYPFSRERALSFFSAVTCPVLLVDGAETTFALPAEDTAIRQAAFAKRALHTLPGAAHMMQRHQPLALAKLLTSFLQS